MTMKMKMKRRRSTMTKTFLKFSAIAALMCVSACDSHTPGEFRAERASALYKAAMEDYTSGRLDAAVKGFEKVLRADPGNASARFQLACLLQDRKQDYLGAVCSYREYLLFASDSDKAKLAKERLAICEKLLAEEYIRKSNPDMAAANAEAVKVARAEMEKAKEDAQKSLAGMNFMQGEVAKVQAENARLRKLLASIEGDDEEVTKTDVVASVHDLLDEEDAEAEIKATALDAAKTLNALAEAEDSAFGSESSMLPLQAADAKAKKKAEEDAERKRKADQKAKLDAIPDTYVVQDGDTLYKIALKFYGRTSAWKSIREANKATISTDGRIRSGMTINLPK